jgi:hypothetical protein
MSQTSAPPAIASCDPFMYCLSVSCWRTIICVTGVPVMSRTMPKWSSFSNRWSSGHTA